MRGEFKYKLIAVNIIGGIVLAAGIIAFSVCKYDIMGCLGVFGIIAGLVMALAETEGTFHAGKNRVYFICPIFRKCFFYKDIKRVYTDPELIHSRLGAYYILNLIFEFNDGKKFKAYSTLEISPDEAAKEPRKYEEKLSAHPFNRLRKFIAMHR